MQTPAQTAPNSAVPSMARRRATTDDIARILGADDEEVTGHAAGTLYVAPDGYVLLLRRSSGEGNFAGHWALPGGGVDDGETPEQGAAREAREEMGGAAPDGARKLIHQTRTPTGMMFHTFRQDVPDRFIPRLNDEHTGYTWASRDKLPQPMHPQVAKLLGGMGSDEFSESDHPRAPDGKFGPGGGGSNGGHKSAGEAESKSGGGFARGSLGDKLKKHADTIKKNGAQTAEWLKGKSAKEVITAVVTDHRGQEAVSYLLQTMLSHGTGVLHHVSGGIVPNVPGLDPSTWGLNEHMMAYAVKHAADLAGYTAGQTKAAARTALQAMIAVRTGTKAPVRVAEDDEEDGITAALQALLDLLEDDEDEAETGEKQPEKKAADCATDSALVMALDRDTVRDKDRDGRLRVAQTNLSKATVNPYHGHEIPDWEALGLDPNKVYYLLRDPKELEKAAPTFNGVQLLRKHTPVSAADHQPWDVVGTTGTDAAYEHPYLRNSLHVWEKGAIDDIESDAKKELSCGYHYRADMTPGNFDGKRFDGIMRDIVGNHVALVKDGRAGPDVVVGDSNPETMMSTTENRDVAKRMQALAMRGVSINALVGYLKPRMAMDAKISMAKVFDGVTGANFKEQKPILATRIKALAKGKLAQDATLDDVEKVLDLLEGHEIEGSDASVSEKEHNAMEAAAHGASELGIPEKVGKEFAEKDKGKAFDAEQFKGFLKERGMGEDDISTAMGMLPTPATDEASETDEEKKKREAEEAKAKEAKDAAMKDMVSKPAMDAAIATATSETEKRIRKEQQDIRSALAEVRPYVGELPETMAFDSGEAVRRHALGMLGVPEAKTAHADALAPILRMQKKAGDRTSAEPTLAMDASSLTKFQERFPGAKSIQTV